MTGTQLTLQDAERERAAGGNPHLVFDGSTYDAEHDLARLSTQFEKVRAAMLSGKWFTLGELQKICGGSESGISARVRDLKKKKFGSYPVERRRRGEAKRGLWEYRIVCAVKL